MKKELKDQMLEAIFIKTGGRPENPKIADICAEIAVNFISSKPDVSGSLPCLQERNGGKQCKTLCEGCFQLYKKECDGGNDR